MENVRYHINSQTLKLLQSFLKCKHLYYTCSVSNINIVHGCKKNDGIVHAYTYTTKFILVKVKKKYLKVVDPLKGIGYICIFFIFLLSNLESCNLACVCKIEIPQHFVPEKFSIFGLEISLQPENYEQRRPTEWYKDLSPLGLHSQVRAHFKEEELLYHVTFSFFLILI